MSWDCLRTFSCLLGVCLLLPLGCVDTSIPDLSQQLGNGPSDGPYCTPQDIEYLPPQSLRLHFIDVGQGDAIWVQTPWYSDQELETLNVLIDAGSSGESDGASPGGAIVVDYLANHGFDLGRQLDALVITHAHEDHFGGVPSVVAAYDVKTYVDPGYTGGSFGFEQARNAVEAIASESYTPALPALAPALFEMTDLFGPEIESALLWAAAEPPSGNSTSPSGSDINNTSVVLSLLWRGQRVLLMGDAEQEVEAELVAAAEAGEVDLAASVLKVGHHGSDTSSTQAFVDLVFPNPDDNSWAIISSGRRSFNGVQLPSETTVQRFNALLPTYHLLSTENRDDETYAGSEYGDDHVIVTIDEEGITRACYAL